MKNFEIKIANLKNRLRRICCKETCHPTNREDWYPDNPFLGHCAIVTAIVYKKFGGEIMRGVIAESGISHYWNRIDGKDYDLTKEQFENKVVTITDIQTSSVERILNNEETLYRYHLLLSTLESLPEESNDSV